MVGPSAVEKRDCPEDAPLAGVTKIFLFNHTYLIVACRTYP